MKFLTATIVKSRTGPDKVLFGSDLPSSMPNVVKTNSTFSLDVAAGDGEKYVKTHFPDLIPMVIEYPVFRK